MVMVPVVNIQIVPEDTGTALDEHRVLLIAQSSVPAPNTIIENVQLLSEPEIVAQFGKSPLALMVRAFKLINNISRCDAVAVAAEVGATSAAYVFTFSLPDGVTELSEAQTVIMSVGGTDISVNLAEGDELGDVTTKIQAAIAANTILPITAVVSGTGSEIITITINEAGALGNAVGAEFVSSSEVYAKVTATSGAGSLDLSAIATTIGNRRYQTVAVPAISDASANDLIALLNDRWNTEGDAQDGVVLRYKTATTTNNLLSALNARDSVSEVIVVDKTVTVTEKPLVTMPAGFTGVLNVGIRPTAFNWPEQITAKFAAARAARLTDGSNVAALVSASNGARDAFGGPALGSLPYFNTPLQGIPPIADGEEWSEGEVSLLTTAGGTIMYNNGARTAVLLGDARTTYKTTFTGEPDDTFAPLNHVDTASLIREYFQSSAQSRFRQSRLTNGDVMPGRNMANAGIINAFYDGVYKTLGGPDFVLVQAGEQPFKFFKQNRRTVLDLRQGRATTEMVVPIVTQLREIFITMKIGFRTE